MNKTELHNEFPRLANTQKKSTPTPTTMNFAEATRPEELDENNVDEVDPGWVKLTRVNNKTQCQYNKQSSASASASATATTEGVGKRGLDNQKGVQWCGSSTNSYLRSCQPTSTTMDAYNEEAKILSKSTTDDTVKNSQAPQTDMVDDGVPIGSAPGSGTGYSPVQDTSSGTDDTEELKLAKSFLIMK